MLQSDASGNADWADVRWKINRQAANATGTTTIVDEAQSNILRLEVPTMTANTTLELPAATAALLNATVIVKFSSLAGFTATLQVAGGGQLENSAGANVTSFTNTTDDVSFTFRLNSSNIWEQD